MGCLLSDSQIEDAMKNGRLVIKNFSGSLEPASYDLRTGDRIISLTRGLELEESDGNFIIHPGELVLVESLEKVGFPPNIQGRICSKVSLLKKGFSSISTKIDPGYGFPNGWALLLVFRHVGHEPIKLRKGDPICSLEFDRLEKPARKPYSGEEPKTILLKPFETVDPLSKEKPLDFTKLEKSRLEEFYGHPMDDLFLSIAELQRDVVNLKKSLPKKRAFWKTMAIAYYFYFMASLLVLLCAQILFPSVQYNLALAITFIGILAGVIGTILNAAKPKNKG